jgi:hypothetical protein
MITSWLYLNRKWLMIVNGPNDIAVNDVIVKDLE